MAAGHLSGQLDLGLVAATDRIHHVASNRAAVQAPLGATLYLEVLTPGVGYRLDDSGLQFATGPMPPVNEAPAGPMLALGAALVWWLGRRRNA